MARKETTRNIVIKAMEPIWDIIAPVKNTVWDKIWTPVERRVPRHDVEMELY